MDPKLNRRMLENSFHTLVSMLHERGVSYETPSDDELKTLSDLELSSINRQLGFLARTPPVRN